jgi:hypothetical protein
MFKKLLLAFSVVFIVIILWIIYFKSTNTEKKVDYIVDKSILILETQLKNKKINSLKVAIAISKNKALVDALENDDEDLGYEILSDITQEIKKSTNTSIKTQIITKEYNIFSRSWDNSYVGMPLKNYRNDLEYFKTHTNPKSSIEIGRMLSIKTTVPIYKNNTLLGFVEIINFFDSITDFFKNMGIELYVLMDEKYLDISVFMQNNETINKYIISNRNFSYTNVKMLKGINFEYLKTNQILYKNSKYIFYEDMKNGDRKSIGMFLFVIDEKYLEYFKKHKDEVSFFINITRSNLYDVIKETQYENIFKDKNIQEALSLKSIISNEDKEIYLRTLKKELNRYTKDELIQIILEKKIVDKVEGEIK